MSVNVDAHLRSLSRDDVSRCTHGLAGEVGALMGGSWDGLVSPTALQQFIQRWNRAWGDASYGPGPTLSFGAVTAAMRYALDTTLQALDEGFLTGEDLVRL
jgi:hypothetical protein